MHRRNRARRGCYGRGMELFVSHTTALRILRRWELRHRLARGERCDVAAPSSLPDRTQVAAIVAGIPALIAEDAPIEVIVSSGRPGPRRGNLHAHLCRTPLPPGSAVRVCDDVVCASPELVAVQMAPSLTFLELVFLLSELLGLYAICPESEEGMFQRQVPLTTPERLLSYLDALGTLPGTGLVRRALTCACVRSGSPRETKLALRLGLRPGLGGYGLNVLAMNEPVMVARIGDALSSGVRRPDIIIARNGVTAVPEPSELVAVEYNGRHHNEPARIAQDATRSNELRARGMPEYVIRREHYADLDYLDGLVAHIRRDLGLPRIGMTRREARRRRRLRQRLYEELERIDGVSWEGQRRAEEAGGRGSGPAEMGEWPDLVPVEAYGV